MLNRYELATVAFNGCNEALYDYVASKFERDAETGTTNGLTKKQVVDAVNGLSDDEIEMLSAIGII